MDEVMWEKCALLLLVLYLPWIPEKRTAEDGILGSIAWATQWGDSNMTMHICLTHSVMDRGMSAIAKAHLLRWGAYPCHLGLSPCAFSNLLHLITTFSNKGATLQGPPGSQWLGSTAAVLLFTVLSVINKDFKVALVGPASVNILSGKFPLQHSYVQHSPPASS